MKTDGLSFVLVLGKPIIKPKVEITDTHLRISWLFFGVWILFFDLEGFFSLVIRLLDLTKKTEAANKVTGDGRL